MKKNRRNRRNKRSIKVVTQTIEIKTFFILLSILIAIIIICLGTIFYRKYQDKITLAKQMDELNKQIEDIFTETIQNISDSSNIKRDSIISLSAVGDILCENEIIEDGYIVFETSYLSQYGIVAISNEIVENPKTNDNIVLYLATSILSIMGFVGASVIVYKKRQEN